MLPEGESGRQAGQSTVVEGQGGGGGHQPPGCGVLAGEAQREPQGPCAPQGQHGKEDAGRSPAQRHDPHKADQNHSLNRSKLFTC